MGCCDQSVLREEDVTLLFRHKRIERGARFGERPFAVLGLPELSSADGVSNIRLDWPNSPVPSLLWSVPADIGQEPR